MPSTPGELDLKLPPDVRPHLDILEAGKATLAESAQAYAGEVQRGVGAILGAVARFDKGWQLICQEVLGGRTAEVQAVRDRFFHAFEERLRHLNEARDLVRFAERVAQRDLPESAQLEHEAKALTIKLNKLSARWQTAEDLEDLAAESIAPSAEKLEAVRRKYGYPQAWYDDDDSKPF
jgi:hypothetical protein